MNDEAYAFTQDVIDKKITARSARSKVTRGGRVRLPHDNLTNKELRNMNGEVKSWRLNEPMTKEEFMSMPDDLKIAYVQAVRNKYRIKDTQFAKAFGVSQETFSRWMRKLGINSPACGGKYKWDADGFWAWWSGAAPGKEDAPAAQTQEEIPEEEPDTMEEPDFPTELMFPEIQQEEVPTMAVPVSGELIFQGKACDTLATIARLLMDANVALKVKWEVV